MLYQLSYASKFGGKDAPSRTLIPQIPARCPGQLFKVSQGDVHVQATELRDAKGQPRERLRPNFLVGDPSLRPKSAPLGMTPTLHTLGLKLSTARWALRSVGGSDSG